MFRALAVLLLDDVLAEERLVLDENDDPSEIMEFGRCICFAFSANDDEKELRSFGAVSKKNIYYDI